MFSAFLLLYVVTLSLTATATVPTLGYCWLLCGEVLILLPRAASSGHRCVTDPHTEFNIKPMLLHYVQPQTREPHPAERK